MDEDDNQNRIFSPSANLDGNDDDRDVKINGKRMIDLNMQPHRLHGHHSNNQAT